MATKFFIGGTKLYNTEEEAEAELGMFLAEHNIPLGVFSIVKVEKKESLRPSTREIPTVIH